MEGQDPTVIVQKEVYGDRTMKPLPLFQRICLWSVFAFALPVAPLPAQNIDPGGQATTPVVRQSLNSAELAELLGPIALYPDALVALILPAATVPSDVVLGARYIRSNGDPDRVDNQPWDESVRALVRYPDVLSWMNENLEWTASVGEAFVEQPADVMNAIQSLRAQAQAVGNLKDTSQQRVVVREEVIRIIPADPEIIYVPRYDPEVVFVETLDPVVPLLTRAKRKMRKFLNSGCASGWGVGGSFGCESVGIPLGVEVDVGLGVQG